MNKLTFDITELIKEFSFYCDLFPGPIPFSASIESNSPGAKILITFCIHGDEIGSLPSILKILNKIHSQKFVPKNSIIFCLGNVEAALANKRFIKNDLNRQFLKSQLEVNYETERAKQILVLLNQVDCHVDLHQTIEETSRSFYLAEDSNKSIQFASYLDVTDTLIVMAPEHNLKLGTLMSATSAIGLPSVCVELFQIGFSNEVANNADKIIQRVSQIDLKALDKMSQVNNLKTYHIVHQEKFVSDKMFLNPGLVNFSVLKKGQVLGFIKPGEPLLSPLDGIILFPKYPNRDSSNRVSGNLPETIFSIAIKYKSTSSSS